MKSKEELKKELHALIDSIDDEGTLNVLHDDLVPLVIESKVDILDELSDEQQKDLLLSIEESEKGDNYSKEEFLKVLQQWRTK
jgi:hypothetical protein